MRGQKAAPVQLPSVKGLFVTAPKPSGPSRQARARARFRANLTPGPRNWEMGNYPEAPYSHKAIPDADRVDPARMPNQKYQGRYWGWAGQGHGRILEPKAKWGSWGRAGSGKSSRGVV